MRLSLCGSTRPYSVWSLCRVKIMYRRCNQRDHSLYQNCTDISDRNDDLVTREYLCWLTCNFSGLLANRPSVVYLPVCAHTKLCWTKSDHTYTRTRSDIYIKTTFLPVRALCTTPIWIRSFQVMHSTCRQRSGMSNKAVVAVTDWCSMFLSVSLYPSFHVFWRCATCYSKWGTLS